MEELRKLGRDEVITPVKEEDESDQDRDLELNPSNNLISSKQMRP